MHTLRILLGLAAALTGGVAFADEAAECTVPDADYSATPPTELRRIAAACDDPQVSRLFYNRAYAGELLADYRTYLGLIPYRSSDSQDQVDFTAYRMFLGLAEAFNEQVDGDQASRLAWLNTAYEQANELAELRMKGYDRVADRLTRQMERSGSEL